VKDDKEQFQALKSGKSLSKAADPVAKHRARLEAKTVLELKKILWDTGLKPKGTKTQLVERLLNVYEQSLKEKAGKKRKRSEDDDEVEGEDEDEGDEKEAQPKKKGQDRKERGDKA